MIDRVIDSRGLDSFDLRFMGLIAVILSVGVLSIYSVTHSQDTAFPFYLKQLVWILLGTVAFLVMIVVLAIRPAGLLGLLEKAR